MPPTTIAVQAIDPPGSALYRGKHREFVTFSLLFFFFGTSWLVYSDSRGGFCTLTKVDGKQARDKSLTFVRTIVLLRGQCRRVERRAEKEKRSSKKIVHPSTNKGRLWYAWQRPSPLCFPSISEALNYKCALCSFFFFSTLPQTFQLDLFWFVCLFAVVRVLACHFHKVASTLIGCYQSRCGLTCLLFWMPPCCHLAKCYHTRHWDNGQNAQQDRPQKQHDR